MRLLPIALILFLFSCNSETEPTDTSELNEDGSQNEVDSSEMMDPFVEEALPEIDADKDYQALILKTTQYHSDEIEQAHLDAEWIAIAQDFGGHYYRKEVEVNFERVQDPIVDEDGEMTGWEVSVENEDPVLLIAGLDFLNQGGVYTLRESPFTLYPEEDIIEEHEGTMHRFYAEGEKTTYDEYGDVYTSYSLYLEIEQDGEKRTQLIVEQDSFDDSMISVLFIGDIDGDGILDIVTDNTYHYNVELPTLYLSRPAQGKDILKQVGQHRSVGC